jgi:hypothetical protein
MITPNRYVSGWESGCGPADPTLSNISTTAYTSTGYGAVGVGTINRGTPATVAPQGQPAQLRAYALGGQLYLVDSVTGVAYSVGPAAQVPQPPIYSPTK